MQPFLHTYSIVARDEKNGQLGVAVQSHWFNVGAMCPWVEAGVGAIATQSMVKVSYGPQGLNLLRSGKNAQQALEIMLAQDAEKESRQVAIVDSTGGIAVHTGKRCIAEAGHLTGDGFSVQANMMKNNTVWSAMANAFQQTCGDLAKRMLAALQAAQAEGGDIRGKQSAAMLVAEGPRTEEPYEHILIDLRVDDHEEPLVELARLLYIDRAYGFMNAGDELLSKGDLEGAMQQYTQGAQLAPHIDELPFWQAATLAENGHLEEALPIFNAVFKANPDWAVVLQRLPAAGLFPDDIVLMNTILQELEN
ncbi:MAG TPA: Zn-dependent protease [Anaerolineaceae bacterium]|nr:Zn-dependent protease [Anaerolineaceae bacterium]